MKRILSLFICLTMALSLCSFNVLADEPITGDGLTAATAYEIRNATDFTTYVTEGTTSYFKLVNDIVLDGSAYVPVTFKGTLDGQNHSITFNYDISDETTEANAGLFIALSDGSLVKNLVLKGSYKGNGKSETKATGALVGYIKAGDSVTVENVVNYASVEGNMYCGGIIGSVAGSNVATQAVLIENCINYGSVTALDHTNANSAGGIIGVVARNVDFVGTIGVSICYNYGSITCGVSSVSNTLHAGGIVGSTTKNATKLSITKCGNYGAVESFSARAGGIIGLIQSTAIKPIEECFNVGSVTAHQGGGMIGGIAGASYSATWTQEFKNCFNAGALTVPSSNAYGIAPAGKAEKCYNIGTLTSSGNKHPIIHSTSLGMTDCYALTGTGTSSTSSLTQLTEAEFTASLPSGLGTTYWEMVAIDGVADYYKYPQIKGNTLFYDYKTLNFDSNTYASEPENSSQDGVISGTTALSFEYGKDIFSTPLAGYKISRFGTYSGLSGTKMVYTDTPFTVSKSAVIYVAAETAYTDNGFEPILNSLETTPAKLSTVCGKQYVLSKSSVIVDGDTPVEVNLTDSAIKVAFIKWADNVSVTAPAPVNGSLKINGGILSSNYSANHIKGDKIELTLTPNNGYYLKEVSANGTKLLENKIEEASISFYPSENTALNTVFERYELDRELEVVRTTNMDSTIKQELVLTGNATQMLAGKNITLNVNKNSSTVLTYSDVIGADGSYEVKGLFNAASDDYDVEALVEISTGYTLTFAIDDDIDTNGTKYYIPSVTSLNTLLVNLNTDKENINKATLINDIQTDTDLNFNTVVFGTSSFKTPIVEAFLAHSEGTYTVENIYGRFDDAVIYNTLANTELASDVRLIVDNYDSYLDIKSNSIYTNEFNSVANKDLVYKNMSKLTYANYAGIKEQFILSVILDQMKNVSSYSNIYTVLDNYKTTLGITDKMTTYGSLDVDKMGYASNYIYTNIANIRTKANLQTELDNAFTYANTYTPPQNPGQGGAGGGGGGGGAPVKETIEVGKDEPEEDEKEEENTPATPPQLAYFTDIASVSWANEAINELHRLGVINGRESGKFYPNDLITRAEFVKIIVDIFDFESAEAECEFTDVKKDDWYYDYIAQAKFFGIVSGREDLSFGANDYITRQDMATIVVRAIYRASKHETLSNTTNVTATFADINNIDSYAKNAVLILAEDELVKGYEDGSFLPHNNTTRAEAAQLIYNVNKFINK